MRIKPITSKEIEYSFSDAQTLALVGEEGRAALVLASALKRAQTTIARQERLLKAQSAREEK